MGSLWYPSVKEAPMMGRIGLGGGAFSLGRYSSAVDPGGSVYYNANEYMYTSATSVFDFDQNNSFCVEAFINMYEMSRYNYVALRWSGGTDGYRWRFGVDTNNKLFFAGAITAEQGSSNMTTDTWYHVAAVREGSNQGYSNYLRLYVDGTEVDNNSGSGSGMTSSHEPIAIGANREATQYSMRGYISNLRITVNQPVYTGAFTKPSSPLTMTSQGVTSSNVRLLCCKSTDDPTDCEHIQSGSLSTSGSPTASSENPF
tara:strand:- start:437 stop:1207 length:771 start_codon:yes stop_codon:yes gene_type:complete